MDAKARSTGKQRRQVRAALHGERPAIQVGKAGITPALVRAIDDALTAREAIKVRIAGGCPLEPDEVAAALADALAAEVLGVAGRTILLHRPHPDEDASS